MRAKGRSGRWNPGAVVLPLAACLASAATLAAVVHLDSTLEQVAREDRVIARASAASRLLHELEKGRNEAPGPATAGSRGPLRKAEARLAATFDDLERLIAEDPEQSRLLALIRKQTTRWARQAGGPAAFDPAKPDPGRELMNGVRIFLASFLDAETARRDRLGTEARTLAGSVLPALAGGSTLVAALAGVSGLRLRRRLSGLDDDGRSERQERERLDLLSEAMKRYAIFTLDADGRITSWNQDAERVMGYRASDVLARNFAILYDPEDLRRDLPQRNLTWAIQEGRAEDVRFVSRKDGFRFLARVALVAIRDPDNALCGFMNVIHEVEEGEG